jgi:acetylornithine deacetylase
MGRALQGPEIYEHQVTTYLEDYFRGLGVAYERQRVAPGRDNIVARCDVPGARQTLLLEAHQDTVPTDHMTIDPFAAVVDSGRLYGRGACDIKGGMTAMLTAFARIVREKPSGAMNVVMACTVDEEHTFLGVQELVKRGVRADLAVVAEPTQLQIVNAHKGVVRWDIQTTGKACHSSAPERGVNAIYRMGKLLLAIEQLAEELRRTAPHPVLGPPTLSVGRIDGGTSVNTVPDRCRIEIDRRLLPGEDSASALAQFKEQLARAGAWSDYPYEVSEPWLSMPALGPDSWPGSVRRLTACAALTR